MDETEEAEHLRFDWFGFVALAVGIGSLQLMLDRGEQVGWFDRTRSWIEAIVSVAGFYFFFAHSLTTDEPFVRFEMFKDRNFVSGCVFMLVIGVVLFGTMALVTPFMQNVLGYPIHDGRLAAGVARRRHADHHVAAPADADGRGALSDLVGLLLAGRHALPDGRFSLDTTKTTIIVTSVIQGIGLGLVFVPI